MAAIERDRLQMPDLDIAQLAGQAAPLRHAGVIALAGEGRARAARHQRGAADTGPEAGGDLDLEGEEPTRLGFLAAQQP